MSGLAWKDRQWGNFLVLPSSGWNWFSLQLDDGNDLMLFVLRDPTGAVSPVSGTLVLPNGQASPIPAGAASVTSTGTWQSPHNGATYPSGWRVVLPERDLDLTLTPVLLDQELDTKSGIGSTYWEGEVTVAGRSAGQVASGHGYVELTGYARTPDSAAP